MNTAFQSKKIKYRTVDTRTLKGLKTAERLQANGWTIGSVGLFTIQFYKLIGKQEDYSIRSNTRKDHA